MADFMRTAKPSSHWLPSDLEAFNIKIVEQDVQTFFGIANLPTPNVSPIIWNNVNEPLGVPISKSDKNFFAYLNDAMRSGSPNEKSMTIDFAVFLLKMLEHDVSTDKRVIHTRTNIQFRVCDIDVDAKVDVAVMKKRSQRADSWPLILVQGDKSFDSVDPEPQLIAAAIAVCKAEWNSNFYSFPKTPIEWYTLVGITMVGTAPQLYKIKFSESFLTCVNYGKYPPETAIVEKLSLPELTNYSSDGMVPLENRRILLKCLDALKGFLTEGAQV